MKKESKAKGIPLLLGLLFLVTVLAGAFCNSGGVESTKSAASDETEEMQEMRASMVRLLEFYNIKDRKILDAMSKVRRHLYIPETYRKVCNPYGDHPCPIGYGQTISQPYIVAYMTECMKVRPGEKVLEVGTGSGYQAAVLAELGAKVFTIEIVPALAEHAKNVLQQEGYMSVNILRGDGYNGWAEYAPFDAVIVTCAPEKIPKNLVEQLKEGGRMILPLGTHNQRLVILKKENGQIIRKNDLSVMFVPMIHE